MTKKEQQERQELLEELKKEFGLKTVTLEEFKDKYGKMLNIKELSYCNYKKGFNEDIKHIIEEHKYAMSEETLKKLREVAEVDNEHSRFLCKREYEVIRVYTSVGCIFGFGALIKFKDNGELRYMFESGLCYYLGGHFEKNHPGEDWAKERKNRTYFTAGGLKNSEVDFIFHGVGFSSKSDMYSCEKQYTLMS